jgi:arylsulfatase A-like enzyme
MDKGFQESLVHTGGGLMQPSWPPDNHYFDPVLLRNGNQEKQSGYCMDIYTDAALAFMEANRDRPFFVYLATNTPHSPLEIDEKYAAPYRAMGLDEKTAKVYGMIANIDENVGRVMEKLKALNLAENTILIFMGDNGPCPSQGSRWNADLKNIKGSVYDGGIRVPFIVRWPARLRAGGTMERIAAHIDLLPTFLDACGVAQPAGLRLDGAGILPLLEGKARDWPARTLFFQWHRGDVPEMYRDAAARDDRWKLVTHLKGGRPVAELYDLPADPGETKDVAAGHPDVVARLRAAYEAWFQDVSATRGYDPPRIYLGTPHENPTILTRQDWRGPRAGWDKESLGYWEVDVRTAATYAVTLLFPPSPAERQAHFKLGGVDKSVSLAPGADTCVLEKVGLEAGPGRLEAWLDVGGRTVGVHYVCVKRSQ